ncbi:MAG: methionyl-tRNA formyltransferase [Treponema sp.]|nr:methionyl-tRNA formyltransferase [Candidatus Treponema caballi]
MKILYAGSPDISARVLMDMQKLLLAGGRHEIVGVLTNPPSTKGRHHELIPTDTGAAAAELGLPVLTPEHLDAAAREQVAALKPDILVCFAYGKIFGPKFMALFSEGGINYHPSLLPLYRGCAPAQAAILNREPFTGLTVQRLAQGMDEGDILVQEKLELTGTETAGSLLDDAAARGAELLVKALDALASGTASPVPQDGTKATYCTMLKKEDGRIDWSQGAADIDARIRAYSPWPGAFTSVGGVQLKLLKAAVYNEAAESAEAGCADESAAGTVIGVDKKAGILIQAGNGVLAVSELQWQAKKAMDFKAFLNGTKNFEGTRFDPASSQE